MPSRGGVAGEFVAPYKLNVTYGDPSAGPARGAGADWFGPLEPLTPVAPEAVASRQWDFPSGFNLNLQPRTLEPVSFPLLRGFADCYDILRLVIETRKDQVARMTWSVKPRDETSANANDPLVAQITNFLRRPDGVHSFADWLRMLLEDLFVIDAPALYVQRTYGGKLYALLPLDGATIKLIVDDWGRTPQPYVENGETIYPAAYQQILKGAPAVDYSTHDLIYRPRNLRTNHAYGFSPVEQILTTVNVALRRQIFTLEYFTSGNIPDSLIGVPESWTPEQIANYQKYWDAYIEGDLAARRRAKFVPGGVAKTFIQTKEPELKGEFDEWLARICCFAFSVSPQALTRQMNRASAETQKEIAEEEGLWPVLNWAKQLLDDVIEREFGAPHLEFAWGQDQQTDPAQQAVILSTYVKSGVLTINEARAQLGMVPLRGAGGE